MGQREQRRHAWGATSVILCGWQDATGVVERHASVVAADGNPDAAALRRFAAVALDAADELESLGTDSPSQRPNFCSARLLFGPRSPRPVADRISSPRRASARASLLARVAAGWTEHSLNRPASIDRVISPSPLSNRRRR